MKRKHLVDFKEPHGQVELEVRLPSEPDEEPQAADEPLKKKLIPPPIAPLSETPQVKMRFHAILLPKHISFQHNAK